jgi:anaerobic magnesium-protoporphyrin IX monomethyl ester cyclase
MSALNSRVSLNCGPRVAGWVEERLLRVLFVEQEMSYEPQGIMSLSAVLKRAGHDVALTVANLEDPVAVARAYRPDLLCFSVLTGSQQAYFALNRRLKAALSSERAVAGLPALFSAFGGPHATFFPDIISEPEIDGVCVGEGEGALVDLADALSRGEQPTAIPNWWFKVQGEIVKNPVRPLVNRLSDLPRPDRSIIYDKHRSLASSGIKHFISSRGCPYNCTYCFNHAYYQIYQAERRGYQRQVDELIDEVLYVKENWPLNQVVFVDDLFIIHTDWLAELAEKWPQRVGLPFFCNARANMLVKDPQKVALLKKAGCHTVSMGIETANDHIRMDLLKRRMTNTDIAAAGRMVRDAGMELTATNILGLPTSTLDDDLATMRLNAQARVSYGYAFLFQPYPGTELGQFTRDHDLMAGTFDDIGEIAWDHSILQFDTPAHRSQVEHLQRLFGLGAEHPRLEPLIQRLIRLPHNRLVDGIFWWVHKLHKGWVIFRRVHPVKVSPLELLRMTRHFLSLKG